VVQSQVSEFLKQAEELIFASNNTHVPVGYGFLLAESVYLSPVELELTRSSNIPITQTLLSNINSPLRLAAHSSTVFCFICLKMKVKRCCRRKYYKFEKTLEMKCPKLFTIHLYILLMHYVLNCVVYEFYKVNLSFNKSDLNIPHFISLVICCKALPTLILNMLSLLDSPTFLLAEQNDGQ